MTVRRRVRLLVTMAVTAALAVAGAMAWVLFETSAFGVRDIEISGTDRLDAVRVQSVAALPEGTPLVRVDTATIERRLGRLREVAAVTVARDWPGRVTIEILERQPAAVSARGPAYALIDREGVAFTTVARRPRRLPLLSTPTSVASRPRSAMRRDAMTVLAGLTGSVRDQVREVRTIGPERIELVLTRGRTVFWGSADRRARKAAVLAVLVDRKARVYDVSAPDAPTTAR